MIVVVGGQRQRNDGVHLVNRGAGRGRPRDGHGSPVALHGNDDACAAGDRGGPADAVDADVQTVASTTRRGVSARA